MDGISVCRSVLADFLGCDLAFLLKFKFLGSGYTLAFAPAVILLLW